MGLNITLLSLTLPSALLGSVVMIYSTVKAGGMGALTAQVLNLAAQGPLSTLQLFGGVTVPPALVTDIINAVANAIAAYEAANANQATAVPPTIL